MIPGIQQQPPTGFHPDDVNVVSYYNEEERMFTHPMFAWVARFPKQRSAFFVFRPGFKPSHPGERHTGFRIDRSNQRTTTRPNHQAFHYALTTALGKCRGEASKATH
ncbi:hypothetical protein OVA24_16625 [Luteolibacter sp. SL250]|uniref:hypothetical protein n=1 Tax=Luteolibacter sp. SL250 TaxID=2995170 RepID=UPI00226DE328|nr:hypothetical protein [Luteolibacter sp. SL250]WAC18857.1 hypothetical protein OVA24_16625 [Luteolibacter sp. SL250]